MKRIERFRFRLSERRRLRPVYNRGQVAAAFGVVLTEIAVTYIVTILRAGGYGI